MNYCNNYTLTQIVRNDKTPTNYLLVLKSLTNGAKSKQEIVKEVWGKTKSDFDWSWGEHSGNTFRGWQSNLFAAINFYGVAKYNRSSKKWYITDKGIDMLRKFAHMKEYDNK